jgi:hypothetical protein
VFLTVIYQFRYGGQRVFIIIKCVFLVYYWKALILMASLAAGEVLTDGDLCWPGWAPVPNPNPEELWGGQGDALHRQPRSCARIFTDVQPLSWYVAKAVCLDEGATLAEVTSPAESEFMRRLVTAADKLGAFGNI